jgi:SAM-dependent methyltransferase
MDTLPTAPLTTTFDPTGYRAVLAAASRTWNIHESLEATNARIHDGAALSDLDARADGYASNVLSLYPAQLPTNGNWLEIGSGTGYIMEAINRALIARNARAASIIGLDVAPSMITKGQRRIGNTPPFSFQHYDGITIPLNDSCLDVIFSVASLQHVPKPFVYNLFLESHRLLKHGGVLIVQLLSFGHLAKQQHHLPWRQEIANQIHGGGEHWHHFYSRDEVETILRVGDDFRAIRTWDEDGALWVSATKS